MPLSGPDVEPRSVCRLRPSRMLSVTIVLELVRLAIESAGRQVRSSADEGFVRDKDSHKSSNWSVGGQKFCP